MVQKFYSITNEKAIEKGTVISTLFAVVVAGGCYFLGGFEGCFADKVNIATEGYDSIILPCSADFRYTYRNRCNPRPVGIDVYAFITGSDIKPTLTLDLLKDT